MVRQRVDGEFVFVATDLATFDGLPTGTYSVSLVDDADNAERSTKASVFSGRVNEIDWRTDD